MDATDLAFAGSYRQAELVRSGEISPRELVDLCLERIERLDPQINAFRCVYAERARIEADQAAACLKEGDERPLLGVPIAIKDDTDVNGDITALGSGAHGGPKHEDAEVVRRLRGAGAIVIGKTNVPELTQWPFTESATWGVTRNPWNCDHTPGGSSGGSAAAVAAGLVSAALGSDGAGSIRIPAAFSGLYGLKPQRGRISYSPELEHWHGLSVYGALTRTVVDSALFLDATHGPGSGPSSGQGPQAPTSPYVEAANSDPGRLRIAVSFKVAPGFISKLDPEVRSAVEQIAELLASLGHDVRAQDPQYGQIGPSVVARYLRGIHDDGVAMARPTQLERRTRAMVRMGSLVTPSLLAKVRRAESGHAARINAIFDSYDILITPVTTAPAPTVGRWEGRGALSTFSGAAALCPYTAVWNATGQPAASVPAGLTVGGLPLAVQLVGPANSEQRLLSLSAQIERAQPWATRRPAVS
ncbi:MAG: amidase [Solirubrobacterales bacterium]|nr:amidase [Solirubrobacterales bacterium]